MLTGLNRVTVHSTSSMAEELSVHSVLYTVYMSIKCLSMLQGWFVLCCSVVRLSVFFLLYLNSTRKGRMRNMIVKLFANPFLKWS